MNYVNEWNSESSLALGEQVSSEELKRVQLINVVFENDGKKKLRVANNEGGYSTLHVDGRTAFLSGSEKLTAVEEVSLGYSSLSDDEKLEFRKANSLRRK